MDSAGISPGFSTILHNVEAIRSLIVRQLLPDPIGDVDPLTLYPFDERPATADRPWVMVNMVTSADGGTAVDGASAGPVAEPRPPHSHMENNRFRSVNLASIA